MMRKIIQYIRQVSFLRIEKRKITQQGTLINAFQTKKVIFIHIPKTAGISLIRAVYGDVDFGGHRDYGFYNQIFFNDFNSYFTFSFVDSNDIATMITTQLEPVLKARQMVHFYYD